MLQRNKKDKNNKVHSVAKLKKNFIPSEISLREKSPPSSFGGLARCNSRAFLSSPKNLPISDLARYVVLHLTYLLAFFYFLNKIAFITARLEHNA